MRQLKKTRVGTVVARNSDKTAVVKVARLNRHQAFKKYIRGAKMFRAHDGKNESRVGDKVIIVETRPLSSTKCWRVQKILEREEAVAS